MSAWFNLNSDLFKKPECQAGIDLRRSSLHPYEPVIPASLRGTRKGDNGERTRDLATSLTAARPSSWDGFFVPCKSLEAFVNVFRVVRLVRVLLLIFFLNAALATTYPLTVTDDLGAEVTLEAEPTRVVSMLPSYTETLCAVGACDKLVGVDRYSDFPAQVQALPNLGGTLSETNVEGLVALEPDLVLVSESGDLAQTLRDLGLTVHAGSPQTFEETFDYFERMGQMLNREAQAQALIARTRLEIGEVESRTRGLDTPSVYYEIDATPYSVGPTSFIGTLIQKAGGDNIVSADQGEFPQLEPEYIVAANPEIIILGNAPSGESVETLEARPGFASLDAMQSGRVVELSEEQVNIMNRPGPRIAEAAKLLASILHPEVFD